MHKTLMAAALVLALASLSATAADFEVSGRGSVALASGNPQTVKALSFAAAKRNAVAAGINRINGPDAARDSKVQDKLPGILNQIGDERFLNRHSQSVGDEYETSLTLAMDDKEFRKLLLDAGIGAATNDSVRSFSSLTNTTAAEPSVFGQHMSSVLG